MFLKPVSSLVLAARRLRWPMRAVVVRALLLCGFVSLIPQAAQAAPLAVSEIQPGVYVHTGALEDWAPANGGDVANLGFIVGSRCVAVIDTGGTPAVGLALKAAIARVTPLPVCYVINTHAHPDHVLGNVAFSDAGSREPPRFVASARYGRALSAREPYYLNALKRDFGIELTHASVVYPTVVVDTSMDLDLGGRVITLQAWPTAHTDNDLTVYDQRSRTLFASDLLFVRHLPALDGSLRGWLSVMAQLRRLPVATVVPGHGPVGTDWPSVMDAQAGYLEALLRDTRAAIRQHMGMQQAIDTVAVPPGPNWLLTDRFHRRNVTAAYAELEWEDVDATATPSSAPTSASPKASKP
ncbi:quinoprotein relay system zinc metallohydrolase 2 [Variovorax sp. J22R133]|uniref:quinoprotein relay system zinc metallohydrolase 2 n=1 Tax=Variovorax brevis TaxID=3053503 RepID=UPI00257864E1|nr:quinoprotein relay system zinc metallohydrolase 2 [Variovorax sp. J22R133]MDM0111832.1 quinoprotein relay system zinc metallohydrolase 2 [Variovorax sp. J22R133]